jgi:hypothetical protein
VDIWQPSLTKRHQPCIAITELQQSKYCAVSKPYK